MGDVPPKPKIKVPKDEGPRPVGDLTGKQEIQGKLKGDRYVRVIRQHGDDFQYAGPGYLVATEESMEASSPLARGFTKVKRVLIGKPLTTASGAHERLSKVKALAVLSSDALSSVAYARKRFCACSLWPADLRSWTSAFR